VLIHRGRIVAVDAEGFYDITLFGFVHGESSCASAAAADASEHRGFGKSGNTFAARNDAFGEKTGRRITSRNDALPTYNLFAPHAMHQAHSACSTHARREN
jgi:hypothetical protein